MKILTIAFPKFIREIFIQEIENGCEKMKKNSLLFILEMLLSIYFSISICWNLNESISWFSVVMIFFISFMILKTIFPNLSNFVLKKDKEKYEKKELILYGGIIITIFLFAFLALFPAVVSSDTQSQLRQVHSGTYTNWHPFIETLIFVTLPTMIYDSYVSLSVFQLIFIGCILLYFCIFLRKYFLSKKGTILALLTIMLNPTFIKMSMYCYKDVPFSWILFVGTLFLIEIVFTKGKWIEKTSHKIIFILVSLGIMMFRHNGLFSVVLMFLTLIVLYKDKRKFYMTCGILFVLFRFLLYGPVYSQLGITPDGGKSEMMGVPMNQIAYIYHQNVKMTKEEHKLLDKLAPKEKWEQYYRPASFNFLKSNSKGIYGTWVDTNFKEIIKFYIKYAIKYPDKYIRSYMNVTSPIWKIQDHLDNFASDELQKNHSFILIHARGCYERYYDIISTSPLKYLFFGVGMGLFLIVLSIVIVIYRKRFQLEYYLPFILVISNTLIIMLLITGEEIRFVYSQILCAVPLLIYALSLKGRKAGHEI